MKTLFLLRHAKSSWDFNVSDHDRPLNQRGQNDCSLVRPFYFNKIKNVDVICCSTAKRAKTTLQNILQDKEPSKLEYHKELYTFDYRVVLSFIKNINQAFSSAMLVGHNPAYHDLFQLFTNEYIENFSTCALAKINFDVDHWQDINHGQLEFIVKPKDFKN